MSRDQRDAMFESASCEASHEGDASKTREKKKQQNETNAGTRALVDESEAR